MLGLKKSERNPLTTTNSGQIITPITSVVSPESKNTSTQKQFDLSRFKMQHVTLDPSRGKTGTEQRSTDNASSQPSNALSLAMKYIQ